MTIFVVASGTALLNGCAGVVSASKQTASGRAVFQLSSTNINFGNVTVGKQATQSVSITNSGTMALNITQIVSSNAQFTVSGMTVPAALAVGQSASLTMAITPAAAGNLTGTLTVTGDSGSSPVVANLSATAVSASQPQLSVGQSAISFGTVNVGSKGTATLVLSNTGSADLTVSTMTLSGAEFSVSGITTPKMISAGQSAQATVTFTPANGNSASGSISIASNDPNSPNMTVSLAGKGTVPTQPELSITPPSASFGNVTVGVSSTQPIQLTNAGTGTLSITQITATGTGFTLVNAPRVPLSLSAGQSSSFSVQFLPASAGSMAGSISIATNATNSPATVPLTGTGVTTALTVTPASATFGNVTVGVSSTQPIQLTNAGTGTLSITQITATGTGFTLVNAPRVPLSLSAGQSSSFSVQFLPASAGSMTGSISIATNAPNSPATVALTGTGVTTTLTVTPASASFGNVTVGVSSTQPIQLANRGTGTLTITKIAATGNGFALVNAPAVPFSLNAGQSSTLNVQFLPAAAGSVTGSISITSNAPNPPTVLLSGTGVATTLTLSSSTSSLAFGDVNTGSSSALPVTLTNTGNANVQVSQIVESGGGFTLSGASTPVTLTPNQAMTFNVIYSPTSAGSNTGTVTIASNATGSPKTISLLGTGVQPAAHTVTLSWTGSTSSISGYNVYRSTTTGSGYAKINGALVSGVTYTDISVQNATTYYYVTTAVDASGKESSYSNQATAVVP